MKQKARNVTAGVIAVTAAFAILVALAIGRDGRETVLFVAASIFYGVSTGGDADKCSRVIGAFLQQHDLPKNSKSVPGRAAVFCNPGANGLLFTTPPTIVIYGAIDTAQQNLYLLTLDTVRREVGVKALRVQFYEKENWIEWKSKETRAYGGDRAPERLLRMETLTRNRGSHVV